jgi:DNA replication protein DnaC
MADTNCPICGGTGWKIIERAGLSGAERCDCATVNRQERLKDSASVPPNYEHASLDNFQVPENNPIEWRALGTVLMQVRKFARTFPALPDADPPGLLLVGDPGAGKTHLAIGVMKVLLERGHECVFFDYQDLIERIQSGWNNSAGASERQAYAKALECEVLVLDDLGAKRSLEWVQDTIESIITHRCNHRKALIATTNLPDDDITGPVHEYPGPGSKIRVKTLTESIGMRARSRLFEMCRVILMPRVQDFRVKSSKVR